MQLLIRFLSPTHHLISERADLVDQKARVLLRAESREAG